jgi:hypothetical protein
MNEFKQFNRFLPYFWQEDGILFDSIEVAPERPKGRIRASKWLVALATAAIAASVSVTILSFSMPDVGAARRAVFPTEEVKPFTIEMAYADVSSDHWARLASLFQTFQRTSAMDKFQDPEVPS